MEAARLQNINLFADAPGQLRDFYKRVFDLHEIEFLSDPPEVFVLDGHACRIYLKRSPTPSHLDHSSAVELCFEVEDLVQTIKRIKTEGGTILLDEPQGSPETTFYALDPAGNHLMVACVFRDSSIYL